MTRSHQPPLRRAALAALTAGLGLFAASTIVPAGAAAAGPCTTTITGAHSGVLNVAARQKLCLLLAVQDGAVNVSPGGALSVVSSTVTGAVTLKAGFTEFTFCGSQTVRGALSATGGAGAVLVGGAGLLGGLMCPNNIIDGAITVDANQAGVTLGGNHIAGAVTASANLGGTTISGNAIAGKLTCSANIPAPTNAGAPNTVGGGRVGQTCSALSF